MRIAFLVTFLAKSTVSGPSKHTVDTHFYHFFNRKTRGGVPHLEMGSHLKINLVRGHEVPQLSSCGLSLKSELKVARLESERERNARELERESTQPHALSRA